MIRELDTVVLARDLAAYGLTQGDVGAVVHCYKDGGTFEVEFVTGEGVTLAVLTLSQHDIRPMHAREILHVRDIALTFRTLFEAIDGILFLEHVAIAARAHHMYSRPSIAMLTGGMGG